MRVSLDWHTVTSSRDRKFTVKGTELANALIPDTLSRFQVCEVRAIEEDRQLGVQYEIRDAHTVTDAEVKKGIRPRVVFRSWDLDACVEYAQGMT